MSGLDDILGEALSELSRRGLRRQIRPAPVKGVLNVSSNDYLGLARHPLLAARSAEWGARYGTGAGASRLVTGTLPPHERIEARLAAFKRTEAALLFASGWQLNASVVPALVKALPRPLVFADRLIHASLHHGMAAAGLRQIRFRHNDFDHLESLLDERAGADGTRLIVTESVFSMDGDRADLPRLKAIAARHRAILFVDEAHATGVLGPGGAGLSVQAGGADLVMGTFSKAFGSFGAYVAGSRVLCDYLANSCSGFIHTTALPPAVLGAVDAALDLMPELEPARLHLGDIAARLRAVLEGWGLSCAGSSTQIVPLPVGGAEDALALALALERRGVLAVAIRPPTVPQGTSRLRLALNATLTGDDLERLTAALGAALAETRLMP